MPGRGAGGAAARSVSVLPPGGIEKVRACCDFPKVVIGRGGKAVQAPAMLKFLIPIALMLTNAVSQAGGEFRHVVMFKFKDTATPAQVEAVEKAFAELPSKIDTITAYEWGTSESVEGKNDGLTHCFFVTFKDKAGLETYIPHPAHVAFKEILIPILDKALVFDYTAK
jgi:Stress responsive A/B Barrel Domain